MHPDKRQPLSLEATHVLISQAQAGDRASLEELFSRYSPRLMLWASGRISSDPTLRHLAETSDLVQDVLTRTFENLGTFRQSGSPFIAFLRTGLRNAITDLAKKARYRPSPRDPDPTLADLAPGPLQEYESRSDFERFDAAFATLDEDEQAVIFLRFEMGVEYGEIASVLGRPNGDAVRAFHSRTLAKLRGRLMTSGDAQ